MEPEQTEEEAKYEGAEVGGMRQKGRERAVWHTRVPWPHVQSWLINRFPLPFPIPFPARPRHIRILASHDKFCLLSRRPRRREIHALRIRDSSGTGSRELSRISHVIRHVELYAWI